MSLSRRQLLAITSLTIVSGIATASQQEARTPIKAIAFDGFPIFDPRPIFALAENLFPDAALSCQISGEPSSSSTHGSAP